MTAVAKQYTHHIDSAVVILVYLLYHIFVHLSYFFGGFQNDLQILCAL